MLAASVLGNFPCSCSGDRKLVGRLSIHTGNSHFADIRQLERETTASRGELPVRACRLDSVGTSSYFVLTELCGLHSLHNDISSVNSAGPLSFSL